MVKSVPLQGDIIEINLDPKRGHEQAGYRPYFCLSNKIISDFSSIAVFAPISNTKQPELRDIDREAIIESVIQRFLQWLEYAALASQTC